MTEKKVTGYNNPFKSYAFTDRKEGATQRSNSVFSVRNEPILSGNSLESRGNSGEYGVRVIKKEPSREVLEEILGENFNR